MLPLNGITPDPGIILPGKTEAEKKSLYDWVRQQDRAQLREPEQGTALTALGTAPTFIEIIKAEPLRTAVGYFNALSRAESDQLHDSRIATLRVFEARLRQADIPTDLLEGRDKYSLFHITLNWMLQQEESASLLEQALPHDWNDKDTRDLAIVRHCLLIALADRFSDIGSFLRALITVALPVAMTSRPTLEDRDGKRNLQRYLGFGAAPDMVETAARIGVVAREIAKTDSAMRLGSVAIPHKVATINDGVLRRIYNYKSKEVPTISELIELKSITPVSKAWLANLKEKDQTNSDSGAKRNIELKARRNMAWLSVQDVVSDNRCGSFTPVLQLAYNRYYEGSGDTRRTISALSLLAAIGAFLEKDIESVKTDDLPGAFALYGIIPAFKGLDKNNDVLSRKSEKAEEDEGPEEDEGTVRSAPTKDTEGSKSYKDFCESLKKWRQWVFDRKNDLYLPPRLLGALALRIRDDLQSFDDYSGKDRPQLAGEILHRQIVIILNAVVAITSGTRTRRESPKSSDAPLMSELEAIRKSGKGLHPLAAALLSCPLLWAFLDRSKEAQPGRKLGKWLLEELEIKDSLREFIITPEITVKIGRITGNPETQRTVTINGFFDLLNVMPVDQAG